jgi:hypothetical protein
MREGLWPFSQETEAHQHHDERSDCRGDDVAVRGREGWLFAVVPLGFG